LPSEDPSKFITSGAISVTAGPGIVVAEVGETGHGKAKAQYEQCLQSREDHGRWDPSIGKKPRRTLMSHYVSFCQLEVRQPSRSDHRLGLKASSCQQSFP